MANTVDLSNLAFSSTGQIIDNTSTPEGKEGRRMISISKRETGEYLVKIGDRNILLAEESLELLKQKIDFFLAPPQEKPSIEDLPAANAG